MATAHTTHGDGSFASMLEDRIAARPSRREEPRRRRTDDVGRPTWDWLGTAALGCERRSDLGGAARYMGCSDAAEGARQAERPRDPLAGLDRGQRRAMTFFHDLGEVGLHAGSSVDEIKGAYRRLAGRLHPDAGPRATGAVLPSERSFIELHRHYQTLTERLAA